MEDFGLALDMLKVKGIERAFAMKLLTVTPVSLRCKPTMIPNAYGLALALGDTGVLSELLQNLVSTTRSAAPPRRRLRSLCELRT